MKIYTKAGDDGTTGLLYGGRVRKDSARPEANGTIDEAQAALGVARAAAGPGELDDLLVHLARDLYVAMAEVATAVENRHKLTAGASLVTADMVAWLEERIDEVTSRFAMPTEFVIPGEGIVAAHLDVARTIVRRAERASLHVADLDPASGSSSLVVPYLNRLSDLLWALARWQEGQSRSSRT